METRGSSGSAALPVPRRPSSDTGVGPSRPVRSSDRRPAYSAPLLRHPVPVSAAAPPSGQRWVLVPTLSARGQTRTPESEACATHRERQWQRERREAEQSMHRPRYGGKAGRGHALLEWVYRWPLTIAGTDARPLQPEERKALRIAIEQSEREVTEVAAEAARLAKLK
ncbi:hypothetical protein D1007_04193 [Hordeum vulgare]|nr:hypothetical protein D1007_04193 [Hordeum vulgare]